MHIEDGTIKLRREEIRCDNVYCLKVAHYCEHGNTTTDTDSHLKYNRFRRIIIKWVKGTGLWGFCFCRSGAYWMHFSVDGPAWLLSVVSGNTCIGFVQNILEKFAVHVLAINFQNSKSLWHHLSWKGWFLRIELLCIRVSLCEVRRGKRKGQVFAEPYKCLISLHTGGYCEE